MLCNKRRSSLWLIQIQNGTTLNGYEGLYKINKQGKIISLPRYRCRGKVKRATLINNGYLIVNLCKNNKSKNYLLHRLVAETFIPNPENKPDINHIDGNKKNNCVNNLEWCTKSENMQHAVKTGLFVPTKFKILVGEKHGNSKLKKADAIFIRNHTEISDTILAKQFNISREHVWRIKKKRSWRCLNEC